MLRLLRSLITLLFLLLAVSIVVCPALADPTVWSGLTHSFTKPDGADGSLSQFQDQITPNVYLARGSSQGLYNAATEPNYLDGTSPEFTAWATDLNNPAETIAATNYAALNFDDWTTAYSHSIGNTIVGRDAVVHLVLEDVYLDIKFTSWSTGHQFPSGGFSYLRAEPPPTTTGDYNGDHLVDAADYTIWRSTLGQMVTAGSGADGNGNGMIDSGDYDFWKARFGNSAAGAASLAANAAPEPSSISLLLVALSMFAARRWRR
jgi:hypothetical protein